MYPAPAAQDALADNLKLLNFDTADIQKILPLYAASFNSSGAFDPVATKTYRLKAAETLSVLFPHPSSQPARDVAKPGTPGGPEPTKGNFLDALSTSLKKFFSPGGGQVFSLQFPGRFLQISEYAWDTRTAGIYGQ